MSATAALLIWGITTLFVAAVTARMSIGARAGIAATALFSGASAAVAGGMMIATEVGLFAAAAALVVIALLMGYEG